MPDRGPLDGKHTPQRLGVALGCALAVVAVGLSFTNLDGYAYTAWGGPAPSRFVLAYAGAALSLALVNLRRPMPLLRSPLLAWAALYFLVTTAWAIWTPAVPEVVQLLRDRYRSILFLLAFMLLFDEPHARRAGIIAVAIAVGIASVLNVAEFLSLITFADVEGRISGRASGLQINPNASGLAIAFGWAVAAPALPRPLRPLLLLVAAFGIFATFSRGATICLALAMLWLILKRELGGKWYVAAALAGALVLLTQAMSYVTENELLNPNTSARVRLERGDSDRIALATKAWDIFAKSPVIGNGLGSTVTWDAAVRAHNTVLTLAADHGVLGLILFPALGVALIASRRSSAAYALAFMAAGFTSHTMLESRYALVLTALAAAGARGRVDEAPQDQPQVDDDSLVARATWS